MICSVIAVLAGFRLLPYKSIESARPIEIMHDIVKHNGKVKGTVRVTMLDVEFTATFAISEHGWYRIEGNGYLYIGNRRGNFTYDQSEKRCLQSSMPPDLLPFVPGFEALVWRTPPYDLVSGPTKTTFKNRQCKKIGIRSGKKFITLFLDVSNLPIGWESKTANATVHGEYSFTKPGELPDSTFDWIPPPGAMVGANSGRSEP